MTIDLFYFINLKFIKHLPSFIGLLYQPPSHHTHPKKRIRWGVANRNIIVVRAGDFAQNF